MSYIESAIDEIERSLIGNKGRDIEEVYLKNAIRFLKEHNTKNETCRFCKHGKSLNDTTDTNFAIKIDHEHSTPCIKVIYIDPYDSDWVYFDINYCPMCGRELRWNNDCE